MYLVLHDVTNPSGRWSVLRSVFCSAWHLSILREEVRSVFGMHDDTHASTRRLGVSFGSV